MQSLDATFTALADPTRRAILSRLARGEASVLELAKPFSISQPAISKHLKVLERAGLITRSRAGVRRPCRLRAEPLKHAVDWAQAFRAFWDDALTRLAEHLADPTPTKPARAKPSHRKGRSHAKRR